MFGKLKNLFSSSGIAVAAPVSGTVVPLSEVPDPTFAQGILGPGAAVQPSEGRIVAPANGTVDMMFDTGHAVSMTTAEGAELLIHVGIDTVNLKGEHYTAKCKSGDTVRKAIRSLSSTSTPSRRQATRSSPPSSSATPMSSLRSRPRARAEFRQAIPC